MDKEKVGKYIRGLRESKNITQEQLAKEMHISRSNLSDIENGKTEPSFEKVAELGKIFDVSIVELYAGEKVNNDNKTKVNKTINVITKKIKKRYKRILYPMLIVTILLLTGFLMYYFVSLYNTVKVYKINGESEHFYTNDGIFVASKENIYFSLNINPKNNEKIKFVTLRYTNGGKDELIQSVDNNYFYIIDYYNYNEFFDYDTVVNEIGVYYVLVEYDNGEERINLSMLKQYENKNLIFVKDRPITDGTDGVSREEPKMPDKILKEFTFDEENNTYTKEISKKDYKIYMCLFVDANMLLVVNKSNEKEETYYYYFADSSLCYTKDSVQTFIYKDTKNTNEKKMYDDFYNTYISKYFE